jgi:hypothetical protein
MSQAESPERPAHRPPPDPEREGIRKVGWYITLSGVGCLAITAALKWLVAGAPRQGVVMLTSAGVLALWLGIGTVYYPSPEAVRQTPLEGSLVKTFQAMPLFWKVWYPLAVVVTVAACIGAIIWTG